MKKEESNLGKILVFVFIVFLIVLNLKNIYKLSNDDCVTTTTTTTNPKDNSTISTSIKKCD